MMSPPLRPDPRFVSMRQPRSKAFRITSWLWRLVSRILVKHELGLRYVFPCLLPLYEISCFLPTRLLETSHVKCEAL
jgi:hypothetical protein